MTPFTGSHWLSNISQGYLLVYIYHLVSVVRTADEMSRCWLWLSEVRRPVREEVTRLLVCFTQQGQRERWLVKIGSAVPALAATNRPGV